jgi:hypothetical protein
VISHVHEEKNAAMTATTPRAILIPDVRLLSTVPGWNPAEHLRINGGSVIRRAGRFASMPRDWDDGAVRLEEVTGMYHPRDDWRPLADAELADVLGVTGEADFWSTIQLIELPHHLLDAARRLSEDGLRTGTAIPNVIDCPAIQGAGLAPLLKDVEEWLFATICEPVRWMMPELRISPAGRISSTGVGERGFNGLHIDGWGGSAATQAGRAYNGMRIIVNMGYETRHLIYVNLRVAAMLARRLTGLDDATVEAYARSDRATNLLGGAFLEANPDYPVLRVALPPGHGYIAPTASIPHDGDLRGMTLPDVILLLPHSADIGAQRPSGPLFRPEWLARLDASRFPLRRDG